MNLYDDWVYIGKETYGSRHVSGPAKFSTKFFDVLGRAYDKMKANIKYYVFKEAIENKRSVALEFEVYMRIIEDSDGNDVRVFVKEDKANGLRKDSSFYSDGSWEVFEINHISNEVSLKISSGAISLRKYDSNDRLIENYLVGEKGDTLISEQYKWKNGRLVKTIFNKIERIYLYGKKSTDTVYVIPSDEELRYSHPGYNKSVGLIPEENVPLYKLFSRNPYNYISFENERELIANYFVSENSIQQNVLRKSINNSYAIQENGMPKLECIRYEKKDVPNTAENRLIGYPRELGQILYGHTDYQLSLKYECQCNALGKYQPLFTSEAISKKIEVYLSVWKYNYPNEYWHELCWDKRDIQNTYNHETQHIKNARQVAKNIAASAIIITYDTKEKCKEYAEEEQKWLTDKWYMWYDLEQEHKNENPKSPPKGVPRNGYQCN